MMRIYFAASISGGRQKADDYEKIINFLDRYGVVLTKHVGDKNLTIKGESINSEEIYNRDIEMLNECDLLIAEVTTPSLGVGYEIAYAEKLNKRIICVYEDGINLSSMIQGNKKLTFISYKSMDELASKLQILI